MEFASMKTAHAEAANLLLKQQIHPHFLFNALNTVKSLYRKDPGAGDVYIVHLANFLRASVFSHASKVSKLEDELALLCDYLEMQKIRFGTALECTVDLPAAILKDHYLPSFSLQPLLENAIKHNELTEEAPLKVHISHANGWIIVCNNLQKRTRNVVSANHGLANLAERYRLWSGDQVIIKEDPHTFCVSIKLLSDAYSDH
jgi:LytS/YehU family sensor histidine kinase